MAIFTAVPEGEKYKFAKQWGNVHVVSLQWILESIKNGGIIMFCTSVGDLLIILFCCRDN